MSTGSIPNSASVICAFASLGMDATFSTRKNFGFDSLRIRTYSQNRDEREPSSPARLPAMERSWQGGQPISKSMPS